MSSPERNHKALLAGAFLLCAFALLGLSACKNRRPDDILSKSKMEKLLFDYHLAASLAEADRDSMDIKARAYTDFVLKKHGLTQEDFDRNMVYYCRHTDELFDVYEKLTERYDALTNLTGERNLAGETSGDTLSLWGRPFCLLNANGQNRLQYTLTVDTILQPGDNVVLEFSTAWYYHEGQKRLNTVLAIEYEGDSVVAQKRDFETSGHHSLTLSVGRKRVKKVMCLAYQCAPWNERPRLVALTTPRLLRVRKGHTPMPAERPDSTKRDTAVNREHLIRDSLLRMDTASQGHFDGLR
ncbi:MAG: DUF4296 domain-containing protein [Alloprevotella sp.]|nr:DUF4296 domain-containing protein [Alloprevotella sp.]